jgi:hypothetical protein
VLGLGDAVTQVVADAGQAGPLRRVRPQEGAAQAAVFVDAAGPVGAAAVAERKPAAFEMTEEFLPFGVGGGSVLFAGRSSRRRAMNARCYRPIYLGTDR